MWPPKKKSNLEKIAKAYKRNTKSVTTTAKYAGEYGQNPKMDQKAKSTGVTLKQGDTYSFTGVSTKRVPKGNEKPMGMTYGVSRGGPGTRHVKKSRAK